MAYKYDGGDTDRWRRVGRSFAADGFRNEEDKLVGDDEQKALSSVDLFWRRCRSPTRVDKWRAGVAQHLFVVSIRP